MHPSPHPPLSATTAARTKRDKHPAPESWRMAVPPTGFACVQLAALQDPTVVTPPQQLLTHRSPRPSFRGALTLTQIENNDASMIGCQVVRPSPLPAPPIPSRGNDQPPRPQPPPPPTRGHADATTTTNSTTKHHHYKQALPPCTNIKRFARIVPHPPLSPSLSRPPRTST